MAAPGRAPYRRVAVHHLPYGLKGLRYYHVHGEECFEFAFRRRHSGRVNDLQPFLSAGKKVGG